MLTLAMAASSAINEPREVNDKSNDEEDMIFDPNKIVAAEAMVLEDKHKT